MQNRMSRSRRRRRPSDSDWTIGTRQLFTCPSSLSLSLALSLSRARALSASLTHTPSHTLSRSLALSETQHRDVLTRARWTTALTLSSSVAALYLARENRQDPLTRPCPRERRKVRGQRWELGQKGRQRQAGARGVQGRKLLGEDLARGALVPSGWSGRLRVRLGSEVECALVRWTLVGMRGETSGVGEIGAAGGAPSKGNMSGTETGAGSGLGEMRGTREAWVARVAGLAGWVRSTLPALRAHGARLHMQRGSSAARARFESYTRARSKQRGS